MSTQLLASAVLDFDGAPSIAFHADCVCVAATVATRPWTFVRLSRDLNELHRFQGGTNPSNAPQLFAPGEWRWAEMSDHPDGWEEWRLTFEGPTLPVTEPTGRRLRGGTLQWRDGHVVSYVANGHLEWDGEDLSLPDTQGAACIAGDWIVTHNHGNNRIWRIGNGVPWTSRDVPSFLFGQAQIAPDGTVVYSEFPHGKVTLWRPDGTVQDGEMPQATPQNPNFAWSMEANYWICSGHDGQACSIGSDYRTGYLLIPGGSEPYARACDIGNGECAIARWDSINKVIRVDTLSLDQPFQTDDPVDPPDPPPQGENMLTAEDLLKIDQIVKASEGRVITALNTSTLELARRIGELATQSEGEYEHLLSKVDNAPIKLSYGIKGTLNPK